MEPEQGDAGKVTIELNVEVLCEPSKFPIFLSSIFLSFPVGYPVSWGGNSTRLNTRTLCDRFHKRNSCQFSCNC